MAETELLERARQLAEKCNEFNVSGQVMQISPGPVVTTFEFKPDPGVKYSRVTSLVDDLCLATQGGVDPHRPHPRQIDGRYRGSKRQPRDDPPPRGDRVEKLPTTAPSRRPSPSARRSTAPIYAADLAKMPHLLIAGAHRRR
jgi:S-DNA-T family DNA segregation ATPase FtsK/SpoIIIE